jgi:rhodanese-related sulfurtransferase
MPTTVERGEIQRLVESDGAQLLEVLPPSDYEWAHLPDARNIPLRELDDRAPHELDKSRPVISYCNDFQ